jgi:hypothetical protein
MLSKGCKKGSKDTAHAQCLEIQNGHLGGDEGDDIPTNTMEIWAGSLNPLYVILSIPTQISGISKIHKD